MSVFDRHARWRRHLAGLLAVVVCACSFWRPAAGSSGDLLAGHPDQVRVTLVQGDPLVLYAPVLRGDTIVAYRQKGVDSTRTTVLMRDVKAVEVRQLDVPRTLGVVVASALGFAILKIIADEIGPAFRCDPSDYIRTIC